MDDLKHQSVNMISFLKFLMNIFVSSTLWYSVCGGYNTAQNVGTNSILQLFSITIFSTDEKEYFKDIQKYYPLFESTNV